jgi:DNA-binding NarL/FixJ family response regulator
MNPSDSYLRKERSPKRVPRSNNAEQPMTKVASHLYDSAKDAQNPWGLTPRQVGCCRAFTRHLDMADAAKSRGIDERTLANAITTARTAMGASSRDAALLMFDRWDRTQPVAAPAVVQKVNEASSLEDMRNANPLLHLTLPPRAVAALDSVTYGYQRKVIAKQLGCTEARLDLDLQAGFDFLAAQNAAHAAALWALLSLTGRKFNL